MALGLAASWQTRTGVATIFVGAMAVGLSTARPFAHGTIGPDAAAPVIEFQRLLAGQRLEGYLSQTSKPLLTIVYGLAHGLTGDWRAVSVLAIVSFALLAALAALLAHRLSGPAAAAFVGVALALSPRLLHDVTLAYGISWALLACTIAGLAVCRERPRHAVAGLALAVGALARPEVLAVTALALAWVLGGHLVARSRHTAPPPTGAWLLGLGLLAIVVLSAHDWALTGDALFWLNTAQNNSAGKAGSAAGAIRFVLGHLVYSLALLPLAGVAVVDLITQRRWVALAGATIVPVAVAVFFTASGVRGTVLSFRYLTPMDLGLVFAAGIGLGALDAPRAWRAFSRRPSGVRPAAVVVGAALALALAPSWLFDTSARASIAAQRRMAGNANRAFATLSTILAPVPEWRGVTGPGASPQRPLVLIPARLRAQGIVDLDLPLWAGTKSSHGMIRPADGLPAPGTIIYHDRAGDGSSPDWNQLEVSVPTVVGRLRFVPLFVDQAAGVWIVRVDSAEG